MAGEGYRKLRQSVTHQKKNDNSRSCKILNSSRLLKLWNVCITKRYLIACLILSAIMISHSFYGTWMEDFWEHSAVVKELSTNPIHPRHPLLKVSESHPFFSPYLLSVGLFSRFTSLSPVDSLSIVGVLNLVLLLISLRLFINCLFTKCQDAIGFYALVFILFLWSTKAWYWSGFIHFNMLGYALPFPSTFAIATTFLIFTLYYNALHSMSKVKLLLSGVLITLVILTHPTTGVFTLIGIVSITLHQFNCIGFKALVAGLFLLIGAISLAFFWPYYSFWGVIKSGDPEFHILSHSMYENVLARIWPILLFSPFALDSLISRLKSNKFDAPMLMLCLAVILYLFGFFTGIYGLGRIISFIAIIIQIILGARLALLESQLKLNKFMPIIVLIIGLIAFNINVEVLKETINGFKGLRYSYTDYKFLGSYVGQYDVILSDLETSWIVPTFGGKVIASLHPAHWIRDNMERRSKLSRFFLKHTKLSEKIAIINLYQADYILINKNNVKDVQTYFNLGNIVFENKTFILISCSRVKKYK